MKRGRMENGARLRGKAGDSGTSWGGEAAKRWREEVKRRLLLPASDSSFIFY